MGRTEVLLGRIYARCPLPIPENQILNPEHKLLVKVMKDKLIFLYKYYLLLLLRRQIFLLNTKMKIQKIIKEILQHKNIPELSKEFTARHNINIHILCSHLDLESFLLSLATFYVFSKEYAEVILHGDGTLTKRDEMIISKIYPWIKYISLKDADKELKQKGFLDSTIELRHRYKLLIKAIDFHYLEAKERILIIDTDIFLLEAMEELWSKIIEGTQLVFNQDLEPAYGSSKELLERVLDRRFQINLKPYVNTGLIIEPSSILRQEKATLESYCRELKDFSYQRIHCIEQGYIACILKDKGLNEQVLSGQYQIISHRDTAAIRQIKEYDFKNNPHNIETIHLCGWDKLSDDFQIIKKKLLCLIEEKVQPLKISFYPNSVLDWTNPFWKILKDALLKYNVEVIKLRLCFLGLLMNRKKIKSIHFHYVYPDLPHAIHKYMPKRIWDKIYLVSSWYQNQTFAMKLKAAKFLGYKMIYTVHNLGFHDEVNKKSEGNLNLLYNLVDSIVAMGENDRRRLREILDDKDIYIIPHFHFIGIFENRTTRTEARRMLGIPEDKFVYLTFGYIRRYKGIDVLIKVFKKIKLDAILVIAGDASLDIPFLEEIKELSGDDKRIIMVTRDILANEVQIYMNAADIVIFPFRQVSNSSAVILAKSFYRPTICMDKGNIRNFANPATDILVQDEVELERAMLKVRNITFTADKKEYIKGIPSPEEVAKMYKKIYMQLSAKI